MSIYKVFRNKVILKQIGYEIEKIHKLKRLKSFKFNDLPSLEWIVNNDTGDLIHDLFKNKDNNNRALKSLQKEWPTLDTIIAICSPHRYHRSVTFKLDTFDAIYCYYESAFKNEHMALDCAVDSQNISLVQYLLVKGVPFTTRSIDNASQFGNFNLIKLLLKSNNSNTLSKFTNKTYDNLSSCGHLEILMYFDEQFNNTLDFTTNSIDNATINGHWNIVYYILNRFKNDNKRSRCLFTEIALTHTAGNNQMELFKILLDWPDRMAKTSGKWVNEALILASRNGHFEMIQYLFNEFHIETIQDNVLSAAIESNHNDMIQFYLNRILSPSSHLPPFKIMGYDISSHILIVNGHLEILKQMYKYPIQSYVELACTYNQLEILKWMLSINDSKVYIEMEHLLKQSIGHLDILKYLIEDIKVVVTIDDLERCCEIGHLESLQYLLRFYPKDQLISIRSIKNACFESHNHILSFLFIHHHHKLCNISINEKFQLLQACIISGSFKCLELIFGYFDDESSNFTELNQEMIANLVLKAIQYNQLDMIKYLIEDRYPLILKRELIQLSNGRKYLEDAVHAGHYHTLDYILGVLDQSNGQQIFYTPNPIPSLDLIQLAIRYDQVGLIEMIHNHCPKMVVPDPYKLLTRGYTKLFKLVIKWNLDNGYDQDDSIQNPYIKTEQSNKIWFLETISQGNISLLEFYKESGFIKIPDELVIRPYTELQKYYHVQTALYLVSPYIVDKKPNPHQYKQILSSIVSKCADKNIYSVIDAIQKKLKSLGQDNILVVSAVLMAATHSNISMIRLLLKFGKFKYQDFSNLLNYDCLNFFKKLN
ncbi:hypothetical protein DFA_12057 [Cavenderia fasciculata]|uniref:Ankyrin repeat-containing protein n=1 Tax=Cavenderia fasciculata TaxID=261658 RepID=F4QFI6_CACFS|nr:uncharacterized protein DFA_12057 [Cavenderia fasciculata]EGG14287.1 hypothetical protein DFA_12057 [Cavenderia fasciculata]|eukprot:XP_004350996.1 hypothetical protein DFA_12057 [Cavenderia fasciculata]